MPRLVGLSIVLMLLAGGRVASGDASQPVQFHRDVRPILSNNCFRCHGPDAESREADLRLDTREGLLGESSAGEPIVEPSDPDASELYRRLTTEHADERMPPEGSNLVLNERQIATIRDWIAAGAPWQNHWSYEPLVRPELPPGDESNPIDRFLAARLATEKLAFAPPADPVTLARRLSFDLTGLPPGADDVATFARQASNKDYHATVERLLASPHYGERMAVYWLDLVRYADSCGYHSDVEQPISPYRDYVIEAFNRNLPFDQFTREQLAGDLLPEPTLAQRVASGYNRLNKTTEEGGAQPGEYLAKSAADRVRTTSGVWLAATLGCAECHDHKYDPLTTRDFYSFAAFFADVQEEAVYSRGGRAPEMPVPTPMQQQQTAELEQQIASLEEQMAALAEEQAAARTEHEKQLARLQKEKKQLEDSYPRTMITVSVEPREMRILPRGNWLDNTGDVVEPAIPAFLASQALSDGRLTRLDLANWLLARDNPLTARVFVNRLWKLFFGAGLARQLDDFGAQGESPTHPELLDWLAVEFIESGWDVKHLVRLITSSRAYQQSSIPTAELTARDPQNRLLARQGRWRLEAEFIRDTALVHSGLLVREVGGRSVKPYQPEGYWEFLNFPKRTWKADEGANQYRRGLYTHWQRTFLHPSLLAFDAPSREECTAQRAVSNTPQAALALMNDPTYVEAARGFAASIVVKTADQPDADRVDWAWREATSRTPDERERQLLVELLAEGRTRFAEDETAARGLLGVGQAALEEKAPLAELAAWTMVARAILNLHETISRN
ncbi:MAG: PSD1 domain-containing protein [Pirellulales bacterium]|nr:PSD1 domain-containing protein [Pirellulales bacterium]